MSDLTPQVGDKVRYKSAPVEERDGWIVVLKLCHLITWSWWWVLSPIWVVFALVFLCLAIIRLGDLARGGRR